MPALATVAALAAAAVQKRRLENVPSPLLLPPQPLLAKNRVAGGGKKKLWPSLHDIKHWLWECCIPRPEKLKILWYIIGSGAKKVYKVYVKDKY